MLSIYLGGFRRAFLKAPFGPEAPGSKEGEKAYLRNAGPETVALNIRKPFTHRRCSTYLADMGQMFSLLPQTPGKLLDLGCGAGSTSWFFAKQGYEVLGVDIAPDMIEAASKTHQLPNLRFACMDYEALSMEHDFGCAVFCDSLHHAEDEANALRAAYEALAPGGMLLIVEPGSGHGVSEEAIEAKRKYGVTEKEMPPWKTVPLLRRVGFRKIDIVYRVSLFAEAVSQKNALKKLLKLLLFLMKRHSGIVVAYK